MTVLGVVSALLVYGLGAALGFVGGREVRRRV